MRAYVTWTIVMTNYPVELTALIEGRTTDSSWDFGDGMVSSVSSVNWRDLTATIQDDGKTKTFNVSPPTGNRFYRLFKP